MESNPFRSAAVRPGTIEYWLPEHDQASDDAQWLAINRRLRSHQVTQIVGEHGTGKSTFLQTYLNKFSTQFSVVETFSLVRPCESSWLVRHRHRRRQTLAIRCQMAQMPPRSLVVIDGGEQLWGVSRRQLIQLARAGSRWLILTTHQKFRGISVLHHTRVVEDRLKQMTRRLVQHSSPGVKAQIERRIAFEDLSGVTNVRDYWFELYDEVQDMICELSAPSLP